MSANKLDPEKLNRLWDKLAAGGGLSNNDSEGEAAPGDLESAELLKLAVRLRELPQPEASLEAENECVYRLNQELGKQRRHRHRLPLRFRLVWVAGVLLTLSLAAFAALHYSQDSLPGDTLYPVKRAGERMCLILERNAADRCAYRVKMAEARLGEYVACVNTGRRCAKVLTEMVSQSEAALKELQRSDVADSSVIDKVGYSCAYQAETLRNIFADVHDQDTLNVKAAIGTCDRLYSQCCFGGACGGCIKERPCVKHRQIN